MLLKHPTLKNVTRTVADSEASPWELQGWQLIKPEPNADTNTTAPKPNAEAKPNPKKETK